MHSLGQMTMAFNFAEEIHEHPSSQPWYTGTRLLPEMVDVDLRLNKRFVLGVCESSKYQEAVIVDLSVVSTWS